MMEVILRVLGFLLRLLVFVITGEWPNSDAEPRRPALPPAPTPGKAALRPTHKRVVDVEAAAVAQRADPALSRMLSDVDASLEALAEPLVMHARSQGIALPMLRFVSLANVPAQARDSGTGVVLVPVSVEADFAAAPERWALLARHVGRAMFDAVPGWAAETYRAHRLPQTLFLPPSHASYDAGTARAALGVWLPELFTDAFATHMLGPAYASIWSASLARTKQPMETLVARSDGRFLSPVPPAVVRMHVVLAVLERLGLYEWQQTLRTRWELAHGAAESLYLPLSDGRLVAIPLPFMLAELDDVLLTLLDEPQVSLGQETWLDIPGFAYLHAEHAQALRVAASLVRGEAVDAPTRTLLAAAALAVAESPRARATVATALARSIRGANTLEAAPSAYDGSIRVEGGSHPTLAMAFRDRAIVRDALVLGAALTLAKKKRSRF